MPQSIEGNIAVQVNKLSADMVMHITIVESREFRIRKAIALWLLKMATWVLGCGLEVKAE